MKKLIGQLFKESSIYGLSGMVSGFIGIFLVPLYADVLSPAEYGVYNLIDTGLYFIIVFAGLALDNSAARWFYDTNDAESQKQTISTWFTVVVFTTSIFSVLLLLFSKPIATLLLETHDIRYVLIPAFTILATRIPSIVGNLYKFRRQPWHAITFAITLTLVTIGLNVFLILYMKWGILGILSANLISNTLASGIVLFMMPDWLSFRNFNKALIKPMLAFSLPLVPTAVSFWLLNGASSYFINYFVNKSEVGLFGIGVKVSAGIGLFITAFQSAWPAFAYSIQDKEESKRVYAFVFTIYCIGFSFLALGAALFTKEIFMILFNPAYYPATFVTGLLCFNAILYGPVSILCIGLAIKRQTKPIAKAILIGSAVSFALFFIFVPTLGKEGAVISTMLGYLTIPVLIAIYNQRVYPMPFNFVLGASVFLLAFTLFLIYSFVLVTDSLGLDITIKCALLLVYFGVCVLLINKYYPNRLSSLMQLVKGKMTQR